MQIEWRPDASKRFLASAPVATTPSQVPGSVDLVTVPNIEILEVGEAWQLSTGPVDFTPDDLVAAIASQDDPAVRTPVLKLGHVDPRFDGQPSFGRLQNLRLTNNGNTLVCDAVGVPKWLAACMSTAYPRRSIEGAFDVETRTGNKWDLVLTGLSLLGDMYPGVETLEDLELLWGSEAPPLYPVDDVDELAASGPHFRGIKVEDDMAANWLSRKRTPGQIAASAVNAATSLDDVRTAFYAQLGPMQQWWWIREVQVNPLSLIVDDDEGNIWQVPVTVAADDTVTFGEPAQVKIEYVAASGKPIAPLKAGQLVAAAYAKPEDTGRAAKSEEPDPENLRSATVQHNNTNPEVHQMDWRKILGLPETATDAEVEAAMVVRLAATETPASTPAPDTDGNQSSQPEVPATDPSAQPATATPTGAPDPTPAQTPATQAPESAADSQQPLVPAGMQLVDASTWDEMQRDRVAANALVQREQQRERDAILDNAIRAGKFPPSRREHYATMLTADPTGTTQLLASMAGNMIPITERGALTGEEAQPVQDTAYPSTWKRHVAAANRGISTHVKVVQD